MKRILVFLAMAFVMLGGCSTQNSHEELGGTSDSSAEVDNDEVANEKQYSEDEEKAIEVARSFLSEIYGNNDFSNIDDIKGLDYLYEDEDFRNELVLEMKYIQDFYGPLKIKDVKVEEVIEVNDYNPDLFDKVYIVNSKIEFNEGIDVERYQFPGIIVSHNNETNQWEIDQYNFPQHLILNDNDRVTIKPMNKNEKEALHAAKDFATKYFSYDNLTNPEDNISVAQYWVEEDRESFKQSIIEHNKHLLSNFEQEELPKVIDTNVIEIQQFETMPIDNATEAFTIRLFIEYDPNRLPGGQVSQHWGWLK